MHRHRIVAFVFLPTLLASAALALDPRLLRPEDGSNVPFAEATETGRARTLPRERLSGTDLESKAYAFLAREAGALGLGPESGLELHAIREGRAVDVVRFRQSFAGLPVLRGDVALSFNKRGEAIFVASDLLPLHGELEALSSAARAPRVAAATARATAHARVGGPAGSNELSYDRTVLAVFAGADRARIVWASRFVPRSSPHGDWEVLVDAETGAVLRVENLALNGGTDGQGQAFLPDPLSSSLSQYNDPGYPDNDDNDSTELTAEIFEVVLRELNFTGAAYELVGPYASCQGTLESPAVACGTSADTDFRILPASRLDDLFEEMNVYYHVDTYMRYINEELLIPLMPTQYSGGVRFDPHGLSGSDNSHYVPATGIIAFGDGGVDDSEDADVVIHELGHGLHDWLIAGTGVSQVQGLSEGLGDYFGISYSRRFAGQWTPSDPEYNWMFSWDGHNPFWGGRVTNRNDTHHYPTNLTGQIHTDGQFWASCNIDIGEAIGYEEADAAVIEGISMTNTSTNQAQAAAAVMAAAEALGYSLPTRQTMAQIYNSSIPTPTLHGCNYGVAVPTELILEADFEENDLLEWSSSEP